MGEMKKPKHKNALYHLPQRRIDLPTSPMLGLQIIAVDMDLQKGHRVQRGLPCLSLNSQNGGKQGKGRNPDLPGDARTPDLGEAASVQGQKSPSQPPPQVDVLLPLPYHGVSAANTRAYPAYASGAKGCLH